MNIILAKSAGFCFGVKRAVETVYKEAEKNQTPIYTFGPIIHNEEVVADLEKKGVQVIHSTDELKGRPKGTVIIRSHGVERKIYDEIKTLGFEIVDATCPFVLKIHRLEKDIILLLLEMRHIRKWKALKDGLIQRRQL